VTGASGESVDEATRVAPAPGPDAGGSVEAAPDAVWYVVVNREQVGPLTPAEVERRYKAGEIDGDVFTWAEGMADWIRLSAVTEFVHLFPVAPAPVKSPPAPLPPWRVRLRRWRRPGASSRGTNRATTM
jgi:hypothetical protein